MVNNSVLSPYIFRCFAQIPSGALSIKTCSVLLTQGRLSGAFARHYSGALPGRYFMALSTNHLGALSMNYFGALPIAGYLVHSLDTISIFLSKYNSGALWNYYFNDLFVCKILLDFFAYDRTSGTFARNYLGALLRHYFNGFSRHYLGAFLIQYIGAVLITNYLILPPGIVSRLCRSTITVFCPITTSVFWP